MSHLLKPPDNCWRVERARRAKLLIDGAEYFAMLRRIMAAARQSILVIGWDFDSRILLYPSGDHDGLPLPLGEFLDALVGRRRELHVYVLDWDFAMLFALDREFLPIYHLGWRTHHRLHFRMDDHHPAGASHHQKIVVVDDAIAFVGGIDLTKGRWDTPSHEPENPLRVNPGGAPYPPFHDVQMMVEGEAAGALGELARERWRRATGQLLKAPSGADSADLWPPDVPPDFADVDVGIARTEPGYAESQPVQEVRQSYLDCIGAAKRWIYVENQYFTSPVIAEAIVRRLSEPNGPEIVVVSRYKGTGWLEQNTMYVLRARLMGQLEAADRNGRLRFYYPHCPELGNDCLLLHTKLMIVDETVLRVGSSNLNNRSLGVDSECDIVIEARHPRDESAIATLRDRLLAEHLDVKMHAIAGEIRAQGSLIGAIERLRGNDRTLMRLPVRVPPELDALVPDAATIDPEKPMDPERLVAQIVPQEAHHGAGRRVLAIFALLLCMTAAAAAWRWGPLRDWLEPEALWELGATFASAPASPVWVLGAYVVASLIAFPITLLIVATSFVFGPWATVAYALSGSLVAAAISFSIGRWLGREAVRRLAGKRVNRFSRRIGKGGIFAVIILRMLPIAPFTVINLVAGASHLRMRDFLVGTAAGMTPGILAIAVFTDRLAEAVRNPSTGSIVILAVVIIAIILAAAALWRLLSRKTQEQDAPSSSTQA